MKHLVLAKLSWWCATIAAIFTLSCCTSCATPPPTPTPTHRFVEGIILLTCRHVIAAELIYDNGHVLFMEPQDVSDNRWGEVMMIMESLGDKAVGIELFPDCIKAST